MTVTAEDYDRTFERFAEDLQRMVGAITSVVRYGSVARGELSPGKSDIMDAYVFLSEETFATETTFSHAIEEFVTTCQWLSETGLPYHHPFHYYCEDEVENLPASFVSVLKSEDASDVFFGEDIRPRLRSSDASRKVTESAFFIFLAKQFFNLEVFRRMDQLDEDQRRQIVGQLYNFCKYVPQATALALGRELGGEEALRYLSDFYPEADFGVLAEVRVTREGVLPSSDYLQNLLGRVLSLIEMLHREIVAELRSNFE